MSMEMTPDRALEIVLGCADDWLEHDWRAKHDDDFCAEVRQASAVLRETLRVVSDDVAGTPQRMVERKAQALALDDELSDDAKALQEVTDVPNFFEFQKRAELIRNRAAFLYGEGDASIHADWQDLSLGELIDKYGWVLKLDADTEAAIDWPEDCDLFNQAGIEYDSAMLDPESEK